MRLYSVANSCLTILGRPTRICYTGVMTKKLPSKAYGYIRVSTQRQGVSGLGLEAQQAAIAEYCRNHGVQLVKEFREVESGRHSARPVLAQAVKLAKATKSTLLIARLDRLARDLHFITGLEKAGVDFRACDHPDDEPFILHVKAAFAEEESRKIGERTSAALQAAKRRGVKLGAQNPKCRKLTHQAACKGAKTLSRMAAEANAEATAIAVKLREKGLALVTIAEALDDRGIYTRTGKQWSAMQVLRILRRAKAA